MRLVDNDEKSTHYVDNLWGSQDMMIIVNESGLYSIIVSIVNRKLKRLKDG
nr:hypothetical protein [Paenibacillus sp. CGMCC 1.18879]